MASKPSETDLICDLQACLSFLADLNGCEWIKGDGPGEIDMRNRAKFLQRCVAGALALTRHASA